MTRAHPRRPEKKKAPPWKFLIPLALVVVGAVAFLVLYEKPEDAVHDDANGALAGHPVAELQAKHGQPVKKETKTERISIGGAPAADVAVEHWFYSGTDVWIVDGKVLKATNRAERLAEVERGK